MTVMLQVVPTALEQFRVLPFKKEPCMSFIWFKNSFELTLCKTWIGVWDKFYRQFKVDSSSLTIGMQRHTILPTYLSLLDEQFYKLLILFCFSSWYVFLLEFICHYFHFKCFILLGICIIIYIYLLYMKPEK